MTKNISDESDDLFKGKIVSIESRKSEFLEYFISIHQLSHNTKNSSERTYFYEISKDVFLVRMSMNLFEKGLDKGCFDPKMRAFPSNNSDIENIFGKVLTLYQKLKIFSQRKKSVITLEKLDIVFERY